MAKYRASSVGRGTPTATWGWLLSTKVWVAGVPARTMARSASGRSPIDTVNELDEYAVPRKYRTEVVAPVAAVRSATTFSSFGTGWPGGTTTSRCSTAARPAKASLLVSKNRAPTKKWDVA